PPSPCRSTMSPRAAASAPATAPPRSAGSSTPAPVRRTSSGPGTCSRSAPGRAACSSVGATPRPRSTSPAWPGSRRSPPSARCCARTARRRASRSSSASPRTTASRWWRSTRWWSTASLTTTPPPTAWSRRSSCNRLGPLGPTGSPGPVQEGIGPPIESRTVPGSRVTRRSRRWALAATLTLVLALAAAGCYPPPPPPPQPVTPMTVGVTHPVGVLATTFVDGSRPTAAFGAYPGSPERQLPTTIWYPSDGGGPYPLVMFAHGFAVTPASYGALLSRIAAAGYVVAAPTYPLLSGQPAGPTEALDWDQLYADTWFVTTQVVG